MNIDQSVELLTLKNAWAIHMFLCCVGGISHQDE